MTERLNGRAESSTLLRKIREALSALKADIATRIDELVDELEQPQELKPEAVGITEHDLDRLDWRKSRTGNSEWTFAEGEREEPEAVKALRQRLVEDLRKQGSRWLRIGRFALKLSGDRGQFITRVVAKR